MLTGTGGSAHRRFMGAGRSTNVEILNVIPASAGPRKATFGGGVVHSIRPPGSQNFLSENHFAAIMLAPSPKISAAFASDKLETFDAPLGMLVINPANVESRTIWSSTRENLVVGIRRESMLSLAEQEFDMGAAELRTVPFGTVDPTALSLAQMLRDEVARSDRANELLIDSVITIFGLHLLRKYADSRVRPTRVKGGLSEYSARRVRDFLENNFARKLSVADLAGVCDLSPGHFLQAFTKTFGEPPHKYLLNRRLDAAEKLLWETSMTISEVAYMSGFSSQSHLTSTMRRYRHVTPAQLRAPGR